MCLFQVLPERVSEGILHALEGRQALSFIILKDPPASGYPPPLKYIIQKEGFSKMY